MRRDTQIGIILGIAILVIIGVFLSTRTADKEKVLPDLTLTEGDKQQSEVEEIDINELFKDSKKPEPEKSLSVEFSSVESQAGGEVVNAKQPEKSPEKTSTETFKEEISLEGKWEGVAEEIADESENSEEPKIKRELEKSKIAEEAERTQEVPSEEETITQKKKQQATYYTIQEDDNLFKIARKYYGNGTKWNKIYEANKNSMRNPDSLYVGQKLLIPNVTVEQETGNGEQSPTSKKSDNKESGNIKTHTVKPGDTLYRIAEKYYHDPALWIMIYEANEDTIEDKGLLKIGQILIIPEP